MQEIEEMIAKQFKRLIKEGKKIVDLVAHPGMSFSGEQIAMVAVWITRSDQLFKNICPKDSIYLEHFQTVLKDEGMNFCRIHSNHY